MKPRPLNRILAHTLGICASLGACIAVSFYLWLMVAEGALTSDPWTILWVGMGAIPIGAAGGIVGIILLWGIVLGPVASKVQGWPFGIGEEVVILTGTRKGTIARVYEIWTERGEVRLELGDNAKRAVDDVYCAVEVCSANKSTGRDEDSNA